MGLDKELSDMLAAATGQRPGDEMYLGKRVYGRDGTPQAAESGVVTKVSRCTLEGCGGTRLHVRWPGGVRSYPCVKGCRLRDDGDYQIK